MGIFSGITADTAKHLQLDAGVFFKNFSVGTDTYATAKTAGKLIGATAGGGSFSAVPTIRQIEVDGKKGAVKGFEAADEWVVTLTANVKEITADSLKLALATGKSATSSSPANYTKVTADAELSDSNYVDNIVWVGRISGSENPLIIVIKNALATNGLSISFADKAEGVIAMTLTGHYDPTDLDTPPFEIYYPNIT